ncbi:MAG: glutamine amidotransferase [Fuerstiella sp.]|nr:glutamine amidotransferase [Fuerstiella sp.]
MMLAAEQSSEGVWSMAEVGHLGALGSLVFGDHSWIAPTIAVAAVGILLALWVSRHRLASLGLATFCRVLGWLLITACLVNPLWSSARPRRGANVLAVVTDISRSHLVTTSGAQTRADVLQELLNRGELSDPNGWVNRIDQDFELQRYTVSDRLERVETFEDTPFDRPASNLCSALQQLQQRFAGQPLAGIVLLSDGNATDDFDSLDALKTLAPVYPVVIEDDGDSMDVAIDVVTVNQTAFDDAPVTIQVQTQQRNANGRKIQLTLLDEQGTPLESKTQLASEDSPVRFEARPETGDTVFYTVKAELLDADDQPIATEATTVNNERLVAVDRGSNKRRVLYVSGRPNWEYKFLRRAVETDPQTELVGLLRIARKEAKFDFRGRDGESSNSLFRGFEESEQELAEEYDEPVLVRLGTKDDTELEGGFPENAEDLFAYDAIILDDIEAQFFMADQLQLIYQFVSKRGGGFLMMGGQESFRQGEYDRTPVGELLPVDLHREIPGPTDPVQLSLTREGWLQPWVRLCSDEEAERQRVTNMPGFTVLNATSFIRPGAVVMAKVADNAGNEYPALVTQRFGRGRSAALCIGDFWRWRMNEGRQRLNDFSLATLNPLDAPVTPGDDPEEDLNDHARACRQMIRWLVGDVPKRLDVSIMPDPSLGLGTVRLIANLKGKDFDVRDDANVGFIVTKPNGEKVEITGEPSEDVIGRFEVVMSAVEPGAYTAEVTATVNEPDQEPEELTASVGWASQPDQEEMASVAVNRRFLSDVAKSTGGRLVPIDQLSSFVDDLSHSEAPLVEVWSWPIWHQWWVFCVAVGCFVTDWTIRRRLGMP